MLVDNRNDCLHFIGNFTIQSTTLEPIKGIPPQSTAENVQQISIKHNKFSYNTICEFMAVMAWQSKTKRDFLWQTFVIVPDIVVVSDFYASATSRIISVAFDFCVCHQCLPHPHDCDETHSR